jgi:hypothetical protein
MIISPPQALNLDAEPGPASLSLVLAALRRRCQAMEEQTAISLAHVWKHEIDSILTLVLEYSSEQSGAALHVQLRDEMVSEFTRLTFWLIDTVINDKLRSTSCDQLDPVADLRAASSTAGLDKIRNTAKFVAGEIWLKQLAKWRERTERLLEAQGSVRLLRNRKILLAGQGASKVTTANHYIPSFTNRPWADAGGNVIIYSRALDGGVKGVLKPFSSWGRAYFLYSQRLEDQLSAIERDAKGPYDKLVQERPFSGPDEQDWITFLISQIFRTPRFILKNINALNRTINARGLHSPSFPLNTLNLRRTYETLFRAHRVYSNYYRAIARKSFSVAKPHPGEFFLKADEPILLEGALRDPGSTLIFPLSPERCFLAGPLFQQDKWPLRVGPIQLAPGKAHALSLQIAFHARETVIASPLCHSQALSSALASVLANHRYNFISQLEPIKPYWGDSPARLLIDSRI